MLLDRERSLGHRRRDATLRIAERIPARQFGGEPVAVIVYGPSAVQDEQRPARPRSHPDQLSARHADRQTSLGNNPLFHGAEG
jgi:hypothetical protein